MRLKYNISNFEVPSWHRKAQTAIRAEGVGGLAQFWMKRQSVVVHESEVFPVRGTRVVQLVKHLTLDCS